MSQTHLLLVEDLAEPVQGLDVKGKEIWLSIVSDHLGELVQGADVFHEKFDLFPVVFGYGNHDLGFVFIDSSCGELELVFDELVRTRI